jgi:hypothetical protein
MPLTCVSNDAILKKPSGLDYSNPSINVPFTLNGAPFANEPSSIVDKNETVSYIIPGTPGKVATTDSPAVAAGEDSIGYRVEGLNTTNIIGSDTRTTLKYENKTYTQKFIAVHQGIWGDSRAYVSILLLSPDRDFFHICIPLNLRDGPQDENIFLKHWLNGGTPPSGFTLNQILNFRGPDINKVEFAIIQYCLNYNAGVNTNPYTLCIFRKELVVNKSNIPWLSQTPLFKNISKKSFDNVLNYMLNDMFKNNDNRLTSIEEHFKSSSDTTAVPTPSHFIAKSADLTGTLGSSIVGTKKLNNIKCYPIDLFNIMSVNDPNSDVATNIKVELKRQQSLNNVSFIIVFSILFGVICISIIVLAVWFFNGKSTVDPVVVANAASVTVNTAKAAKAAAALAAVPAPALSLAAVPAPALSLAAVPAVALAAVPAVALAAVPAVALAAAPAVALAAAPVSVVPNPNP